MFSLNPDKSRGDRACVPRDIPVEEFEAMMEERLNFFLTRGQTCSFMRIPQPAEKPLQLKGDIIILTGIVAAEKSSFSHAIKAIDPQFHEEDLDLRGNPETPTTPEMEMQMIDDTINRSLQGGKTIISLMHGGLLEKRAAERGITDLPKKTVLLHCPFSEIPDRLEARNSTAEAAGRDLKNYRNPLVPLNQFAALYFNCLDGGIETIERAQASAFFDNSFDKMVAHAKKQGKPLPPEDQIAIDKARENQEFLTQLGFEDESQTQICIAPRGVYDLVIDTSTCRDTASRVKILGQLLEKRDG